MNSRESTQREATFRKFDLEKLKFASDRIINEIEANDLLNYREEPIGEVTTRFLECSVTAQLYIQLKSHIWGNKLVDLEFQYPKDWWQAIKDRFAPRWFRYRWPVKWHVVQVYAAQLYPEFKPTISGKETSYMQITEIERTRID